MNCCCCCFVSEALGASGARNQCSLQYQCWLQTNKVKHHSSCCAGAMLKPRLLQAQWCMFYTLHKTKFPTATEVGVFRFRHSDTPVLTLALLTHAASVGMFVIFELQSGLVKKSGVFSQALWVWQIIQSVIPSLLNVPNSQFFSHHINQ